ncbi:MAG: hypothetical protein WCS94_22375 [Verrucomicrobiota bacterium]
MKNSCLKSKNGCHKSGVPKNATLRQLVQLYKAKKRPALMDRLEAFEKLSFKEALTLAEWGKEALKHPDSDKPCHIYHLRRAPKNKLKIAERKLGEKRAVLKRCRTFDRLFREIDRIIYTIPGLDDMYAYDVALRIGASKGIWPEKVYLQRGTRIGAKNLGLDFQNRTIEWSSLPSELHYLTAMEVEDFLCIFEDHLKPKMNSNR